MEIMDSRIHGTETGLPVPVPDGVLRMQIARTISIPGACTLDKMPPTYARVATRSRPLASVGQSTERLGAQTLTVQPQPSHVST